MIDVDLRRQHVGWWSTIISCLVNCCFLVPATSSEIRSSTGQRVKGRRQKRPLRSSRRRLSGISLAVSSAQRRHCFCEGFGARPENMNWLFSANVVRAVASYLVWACCLGQTRAFSGQVVRMGCCVSVVLFFVCGSGSAVSLQVHMVDSRRWETLRGSMTTRCLTFGGRLGQIWPDWQAAEGA